MTSIILENVKTILVVAIGACAGGVPAIGAITPGIVLALISVAW